MNLVRIAGFLTLLLLLLYPFSVQAMPVLDLAEHSERNRVLEMEILQGERAVQGAPENVLRSTGWLAVREMPELLSAPRQKTVIWLRARVQNLSREPIQRWLELSPWRLNQIDAWLIDPLTGQLKDHMSTGLDQPLNERRVLSNRAVVPFNLPADQAIDLLIRIESDSRPFLYIQNWDPVSFTVDQARRYQFHAILLSITLTLAVVLLLQASVRYTLVCLWMLALFVLEAEKEAYISYLLFDGLANYASHLRFSSSVIAISLFMIVSVYLLGLNRHVLWRRMLPATLLVSLLYTGLTFVLEDNLLRNIALAFHVACSLVWPLLIPAALRRQCRWQKTMLVLLAADWLTNSVYVLSYALNINYTSEMATIRLSIKISLVLALLLFYALQKRDHERSLERQLRQGEQAERERLELAVAARTQDLNLALEAARKADAAKTNFLTRVTHDLKSPLTSIMGYAQLLSAEPGKVGDKSHIIYNSASHMLNMINRLINYARDVTTLQVVETDLYLHAFIKSVAYEARVMACRQHNDFTLDVAAGLPLVIRCDETLLREVLLNLLDNAAKYTSDGRICLRVCGIVLSGESGHSLGLCCEVEDSGNGIDPELQNQLFDPFFRATERGDGAGLGLAIVKELVERMDGRVRLNSTPGKGTCIGFTIPVCFGQEGADFALLKTPRQMLPQFDARGLEAWVVEDAREIRNLLDMELSQLGFEVCVFADAESAITALNNAERMPDVILTDHRLPQASGDQVLEVARSIKSNLPVLLLSATWYLQQGHNVEQAPSYTALLGKPVDLVRLRWEVAKACGLQSLPSDEAAEPDTANLQASASLDAASIEQLEQWLELGAVTDLVEWAEQLVHREPGNAALSEEMVFWAERGDFNAIREKLAELVNTNA